MTDYPTRLNAEQCETAGPTRWDTINSATYASHAGKKCVAHFVAKERMI
jgi:hypothetical protein